GFSIDHRCPRIDIHIRPLFVPSLRSTNATIIKSRTIESDQSKVLGVLVVRFHSGRVGRL
ncbi:17562_t:CDS:2, partial [Acaulospora colombiana]